MTYLFTELISKKKNRLQHTPEELHFLITGYTSGQIPDYQMSAWLMAALLNGLSDTETFQLTKEVVDSGVKLDFSDLPFPTVDKHSTGGVGDKTSLIVGPIVAAAGIGVPMIAGRSLGHTGGTVDKLESIPRFNCDLNLNAFKAQVREHKLCIIGQTSELCPADKKLYALRDVTDTIDSLELIGVSIMSKKIAEGTSALVLDIKYGNGAFMQTKENAEKLARLLIRIGQQFGTKVSAVISNMNQPLGRFAGNVLEINECLDILKNQQVNLYRDTIELSVYLAAEMFLNVSKVKTLDEGKVLAQKILTTGAAFEKFEELCHLQGGNLKSLKQPTKKLNILSPETGILQCMNTKVVGNANVILGAGRLVANQKLNLCAGIEFWKKPGETVRKGDPIWTLYSDTDEHFSEVSEKLLSSIQFGTATKDNLVWKTIR